MKEQIPTYEVEIEGEKVVLYEWLTQEEEDKLNSIMLGDLEVDPNQAKKDLRIKLSMAKLGESNKYLVESLVKSHKWDQINAWKPSKRSILLKEIESVRSKN